MKPLGLIKSFCRPATSNDNPFSKALFKTVKYCPDLPKKTFDHLDQARAWMETFTRWYNFTHRHSGIKFITLYQSHNGLDKEILQKRDQVYLKAKEFQPLRWSGKIKNFDFIHSVSINSIP
jgi:putative transposase